LALGLNPEATIVLYLGALSPEKRVDLAIQATTRLPQVELVVVGDGPERARLEGLAAEAAPSRVHFLGQTSAPQQPLTAADVLVVPSATEGQPRVAIEAGLSGLPVVATTVGGLGEIVEDGRTGILVPPGDSMRLAEAVRAALAARTRLGTEARLHCAARFDLARVADQWQKLLRSVIVQEF
jgi:glycosyltransferase involved in cell wall biosynthesis